MKCINCGYEQEINVSECLKCEKIREDAREIDHTSKCFDARWDNEQGEWLK